MKYTTTEHDRSEALLRWSAVGLALAAFAATAACVDEREGVPVDEVAIGEAGLAVAVAEVELPAAIPEVAVAEIESPRQAAQVAVPAATAAPRLPDSSRPSQRSPAEDDGVAASKPADSYSLGLAALQDGNPELAEQQLRAWVAHAPGHVKGRVNLARALLEIGRPYEAREHAGTAADLNPGSAAAWRTLARAQAESGDCSSALASYEEALLVNPEDAWALNNMGYLLIEHGRYEDAIGPLALAVTLDGGNELFLGNLAAALERSGEDAAELDAYVTGQLAERYARERNNPPGPDNPWPSGPHR